MQVFIFNIGKDVAELIPDPRNYQYSYSFIKRNIKSMFLSPVEQSEIISIYQSNEYSKGHFTL